MELAAQALYAHEQLQRTTTATRHTQKATFTVHEISVNVNTCFQRLNYMLSRFARSDLDFPNLGIRKLCHAKRFIDMIMWLPTTAWTLFSVIRQNT